MCFHEYQATLMPNALDSIVFFLWLTLDTSCSDGKICLVPKAMFSSVPSQIIAKHTTCQKRLSCSSFQLKGDSMCLEASRKSLRKGFSEIQWERTPEYNIHLYSGGPLNKVFGSWGSWTSLFFKSAPIGTELRHVIKTTRFPLEIQLFYLGCEIAHYYLDVWGPQDDPLCAVECEHVLKRVY